jgi:nitroreductase
MSILDVIKKRKSVRKFKQEQITDEEMQLIVEAGQLAPSGHNSQTSHFVVIQKQEVLNELRELVKAEFAKMEFDETTYSSIKTSITLSKKGKYNFMYNAPILIVATNLRGYGNAMADCSLALGNMMLMATELNIGTCWINQLKWLTDNETVKKYLEKIGISADEMVCGCLSVGYSDQPNLAPVIRKGNVADFIK